MRELTEFEKALNGNGDAAQWQEIEADRGRGIWPADCQGTGDPDPKYDLAPLLHESFCEMVFLQELDRWFHEKRINGTDNADAEGQTDGKR